MSWRLDWAGRAAAVRCASRAVCGPGLQGGRDVSGLANVIRLEGVTKRYDGKTALQPTTLAIARGECVALIGPSGCGKSTILRLIVGLVPVDGGAVWLDELRVAPDTVDQVRGRLGYVIQEGGLFPHLTAAENA